MVGGGRWRGSGGGVGVGVCGDELDGLALPETGSVCMRISL